MNQTEIKAEYEKIQDRIHVLKGKIEIARAKQRVLQQRCKHPNSYTYSAMGELGTKCPDCGYAT